MKSLYQALLLICFTLSLSAQSSMTSYQTENGDTHLLGNIDRSVFETEPYSEWYNMVYDKYQLDEETIKKIDKFYKDDIQVKIYLGTWCGDSKREVSRFLKIVDESAIEMKNITLIGLDNRSEQYKQGPNQEELGLNIHRVPTFIFYKEGEEMARIVESPVSALETDVAQIYAGLAPNPNYRVANYIGELFEEKTLIEADSFFTKNARYFKRRVKNEGELNTMGYVLLSADEVEKAVVVFKLNTLLFPESSNAFDSLGEAYKLAGNLEKAVENYVLSYQMNPGNENAMKMIKEIMLSLNS